jgi:hypothetical protein
MADMVSNKPMSLRSKIKDLWRTRKDELEATLLQEFAEKRGANAVLQRLLVAKEQMSNCHDELTRLGFTTDYRDQKLELYDMRSNPLVELMWKQVKAHIGTLDDIDIAFNEAQMKMMSAETMEEAKNILESLPSLNG